MTKLLVFEKMATRRGIFRSVNGSLQESYGASQYRLNYVVPKYSTPNRGHLDNPLNCCFVRTRFRHFSLGLYEMILKFSQESILIFVADLTKSRYSDVLVKVMMRIFVKFLNFKVI